MKKNLNSYVKKYNNFLNKEICDETIEQIEKCKWTEHKFYNSKDKKEENISGEQELDVNFEEVQNTKIIMDKIWFAINDYIKNLNFKWYGGWQGYTKIRFNRYEKNKKMAEHCDHIHSMFDGQIKGIPILSVLGILNDNYEGGKFTMFKDKKIKFKKGDLLIFPSIFLYPHKVEPVTKGVRYSYISWVW